MRTIAYPVAALLLSAVAAPAGAILIRSDRDDAEYLELATRYTAAIRLEAADGEGTLIAPRWILTAAHVARALQAAKATRIPIAGKAHEIAAVYVHPGGEDIALLFLKYAADDVEPAPIHRNADEKGKPVSVVGHGRPGRIGAAPAAADGKARAAINTVDRVEPRALGLRIKPHDEASDLQGALGPGDTGGPAFLEAEGRASIAGVARGAEGEWQLYARVSAYADWIDRTMLEAAAAEAAKVK